MSMCWSKCQKPVLTTTSSTGPQQIVPARYIAEIVDTELNERTNGVFLSHRSGQLNPGVYDCSKRNVG